MNPWSWVLPILIVLILVLIYLLGWVVILYVIAIVLLIGAGTTIYDMFTGNDVMNDDYKDYPYRHKSDNVFLYEYYKGYPYCHKSEMRSTRIWAIVGNMPFYGLSIFGMIVSGLNLFHEITTGSLVAFVLSSACSIIFVIMLFQNFIGAAKARIVLYFTEHLPREGSSPKTKAPWAYTYGWELAKNLEALDSYLKRKKKRPLSDFGFHDDYHDQVNEWKDPKTLLDSLICIKSAIDAKELRFSSDLGKEVSIYMDKLKGAVDNQLRCRLIYINGADTAIIPMRQEQREGRFP